MRHTRARTRAAVGRRAAVRWVVAAALGVSVAAACSTATAIERCRAAVNRRDGSIVVSGRAVTGTLRWGERLGEESRDIANAPECIRTTGAARRCTLGPEGSPERTTVPVGCILFLRDDGAAACSAYVRRCTPTPPPIPCPLFPPDNVWNADVSALPVHPLSDAYVASIGLEANLHPEFGSGLWRGRPMGIPYMVVPAIQPLVPILFYYADESDPGPYPIPPLAWIENGALPSRGHADAHMLLVEEGSCRLYEIFEAARQRGGESWRGGSGATWDLSSNALRPTQLTSADAAGLPILPGLVRYEEIENGVIAHAIRVTAPRTQRAYVWPARHFASTSTDPNLPPMGLRLRLKASVDISGFSPTNQIILTALKRYGMLLADNGAPWFITGTPDPRWDNEELAEIKQLHGPAFEAVDASSLMVDPDSGQVQ